VSGATIPDHVPAALVRDFDYHTDEAFLSDPFAAWDKARELRVFWSTAYGGYWVLTHLEDIRATYQDPDLFSSKVIGIPAGRYPRTLRPLALDPPEHGVYRQVLAAAFSPNAAARMSGDVQERCRSLICSFAADGSCEFVGQFARPFPTTIFVAMLGLPAEEAAKLERWNHDLTHVYEDPGVRQAAAQNIEHYLDQAVDERQAQPSVDGDDVLSVLVRGSVYGRSLTHDEIVDYAFLLFMAGLDTVTAASAFAFHTLASRPDLRHRLVADPAIIPQAVEELLRAHAIVNAARTATRDTTIAGVHIKAGDLLLVSTALACRDPEEFDHADSVDLDRSQNRHLAFGAGPHRCLGSHLARLELRTALEEFHQQIPDYRIPDGADIKIHGGGVLGIDQLPLEWDIS
jgi:cytochrome P450